MGSCNDSGLSAFRMRSFLGILSSIHESLINALILVPLNFKIVYWVWRRLKNQALGFSESGGEILFLVSEEAVKYVRMVDLRVRVMNEVLYHGQTDGQISFAGKDFGNYYTDDRYRSVLSNVNMAIENQKGCALVQCSV